MKKQIISEEFQRMQKLAGIKPLNEGIRSGGLDNEMEDLSDDEIEYMMFGEGPTFTHSQGGGHPFFDWDVKDIISNNNGEMHGSKFEMDGDEVTMSTEFDPYDYVSKKSFDDWWKRKSKNGEFVFREKDAYDEGGITSTLINQNNKWYIVDVIDINNIGDGEELYENESVLGEANKRLLNFMNDNKAEIIKALDWHLKDERNNDLPEFVDPENLNFELYDVEIEGKQEQGVTVVEPEDWDVLPHYGYSFKWWVDADDSFVGEENQPFEYISIKGKKIAYIQYNV